MAVPERDDAETRRLLLAAARELLAENPNFSLKTLLIRSGVSRTHFRRCFADKEQLLAALTGQEVKTLNDILDVAQPAAQSMSLAVGGNAAPAPAMAPVTDAWLERRLRVFERALAGLEKRQEKSEEVLAQQLTLIGEQLKALTVRAEPAPAPQTVPRKPVEFKLVESASKTVAPASLVPAEGALLSADFDPAEEARVDMGPVLPDFPDQIPAAPVPGPVSEKEIAEFIAHARRVAQNAALAEPVPPQRPWNMRWLAWGGAILIALLLCAGVLIASGAFGGPAGASQVAANSGVSRRHRAQTGIARVMALADNGNATAQTVLAMDYLKGSGVAGDDNAARRWSFAAANQGQPMAQYLLGTLYLEGNKNESEAVRWFRAAAEQGNIKAMHNLAIAYAEGLGVKKDPMQAVQWFVRAAAQGYRDSEFDLAVLYERGVGVPQSARAALKWYLVAAARGDAPSAARAAFLKQQLKPEDIQAVSQEAASFVPQPSGKFANEAPTL